MFIELHVPADRFLTALRARFKRELVVALAEPITDQGLPSSLFGSCGRGELWLDRIAVWETTLADYDGAGVVTVRQPVDVIVVSRTALEQNGAGASPACWMGTITAVFTVQARMNAGVPSTCVQFVDLESDDVPRPVLDLLRRIGGSLFGTVCEALDLGALDELFGEDPPELRRVALAMSEDRNRLGVHISFETVGSGLAGSRPLEEGLQAGFDVRFDQFLSGQFTADTPDQPWSLHINALLLQVAARRRARRQLMGRDEIRLLSGPSAAFKIDSNGVPRIEVAFYVDVIDACPWTDGDIGVEVVTKGSYTSPQQNVLEGRLIFEYNLVDSDVALCAALAPLSGPLWILDQIMDTDAGIAFLGTVLVLGNIGLAVLFPFAVSILSSTLAADQVESNVDPGTEWERVAGNDEHIEYRRTSTFELDAGDLGALSLTAVVGRNDNQAKGIVLSGTIAAADEPRSPRLDLNVPEAFTVLFDDPCGAEPRLTAFYRVYVFPGGAVVAENGIRILDGTDPLDQYRPFLVVDAIGISVNVPIDRIQAAYAEAPYSAQLLIATTAGVRIITLPRLPILTDEEIAEQTEANARWAPIHCDDWAFAHDFWRGGRFNPRWHVDPPPDELVAVSRVQYWEVLVSGLTEGETVTFEDRERSVLAAVSARAGGRLAWEGVLASEASMLRAGLSMYRGEIPLDDASVTRTLESRRKDQRMAIRQMMLLEQARIGARGGMRGLALLQTDYGHQLAVADPDGVSVYGLARAQRPARLGRWRLPGTLGVLGWQDGWIAWGRYGLAGPLRAPVNCGHEEGVRALVAVQGTLLALTAEGVYRVDHELRLGELVVAAAAQQHMAVGRTTLALAGGGKVTFQRRQGLCVGEVIGTVPLAACTSLTCEGTGDRYSLRGEDGARTVLGPGGQVTRKDPPTSRVVAGEIVARWRGHLAVAAIGGSAITLYRTGPARTLRR